MRIPWKKILCVLVLSIAIEALSIYIESPFLIEFLKNKIVEILITLMAINTATSSFIVSKLQDIGKQFNTSFKKTYQEIKFSLVEQIILLVLSILILTFLYSKTAEPYLTEKVRYIADVVLIFNFIYAIDILRDTGVAMFNILIELDEQDKEK
jgi:hypothetical protein